MRSLVVALLVLVSALGADARAVKDEVAASKRAPMFLFALDGLEWSIMAPLVEQGKLPVIEGLMKRGFYGYLGTLQPTYSPVI